MHNCYKLFVNGRLFCITHTWEKAKFIALMLDGQEKIDYKIEECFIENIGF